ncbi:MULTISPECIES: hypothetical protein [Agrobacterium]|uniref:hypothetical protein n=1 Tax=Agrobacterium TaxID=357 RepID=UPI001E5DA801|nr:MULTISPECIES: hypothetical protein [Agrobacterium]
MVAGDVEAAEEPEGGADVEDVDDADDEEDAEVPEDVEGVVEVPDPLVRSIPRGCLPPLPGFPDVTASTSSNVVRGCDVPGSASTIRAM